MKKHRPGTLVLKLALTALVPLVALVIYADASITQRFAERPWALPAQVYARPLELYVGRPISQEALTWELQQLGYVASTAPQRAGDYQWQGARLSLVTRPFSFLEGEQPSQALYLTLREGRVTRLQRVAGGSLDLVRLEPLRIGGIYAKSGEERRFVPLEGMPQTMLQALLLTEDKAFYQHHGVSLRGIARALWVNLRAGEALQGGSTLTQQLVKNLFLDPRKTLSRKAYEAIMALMLEQRISKDEILQAYINEVYLGQAGGLAIHGFAEASWFYYNRPLAELDLAQQMTLIALIRGPSYYHPRRNPQRALARRNRILDALHNEGVISAGQVLRAQAQSLTVVAKPKRYRKQYPGVVKLVRQQLQRDYPAQVLQQDGLRIFTTLDPWLQQRARWHLQQQVTRLPKADGLNGALVLTRNNGDVLALVGDKRPYQTGFNRALAASRPIGSLVKPAVYLTALQQPQNYHLFSELSDQALRVALADGEWAPQNFSRRAHGQVPLYQALARSYNLATARLGLELGLEPVAETLAALNVPVPEVLYPSVLLGALNMTPVQVAGMYLTLAAGGYQTPLRSITGVTDAEGGLLKRYPLQIQQGVDEASVFLVDWALQQTFTQGTAQSVAADVADFLPLAGKTGTSDEGRDAWFAGYSQDYVAVVWIGRDDNQVANLTGAGAALPVWSGLFTELAPQPRSVIVPPGIDYHWLQSASGRLSRVGCEGVVHVPFHQAGLLPGTDNECPPRRKDRPWWKWWES